MLKALGLSKKKPPGESLINAHKEQLRIYKDLEIDASFLRKIVSELDNAYSSAKGDFVLGRYEELKNMIKQAVATYKQRTQLKQERQVARYQHKKEGDNQKRGAGGLRANAEAFSERQTKLRGQEQHYSEVTAKQLEKELEDLKADNRQMRQEIHALNDKLDKLSKEYEASKKYNPTKRYDVLKDLIKAVTRT